MTNDASKLPETAAALFQSYGLPVSPEKIITSGSLLKTYFAANGLSGTRCAVLGPGDSRRYVELAGGRTVELHQDFDVLVIGDESGYPFLETVDRILGALFAKIERRERLRLILPNPDLIFPKADRGYGFASGSIALMFEAAIALKFPNRPDLRFVRLGKPHGAIFDEAQRRAGTPHMVMIGDQLETDIRGANRFGIDSVLVDGGLAAAAADSASQDSRPTYRLRTLVPIRQRDAGPP